ncbi:MAG: hypothetical protein CMQ43_13305 [Gammaproteobacteria bacterium]|jgi:hypothetical protein|nr:hypothetical protein [Gammaproteobacteria bacterium]|tara:strand:- start:1891 stop:2631 length:741 start_codon:yes stop_codon:yes gene_type:complete
MSDTQGHVGGSIERTLAGDAELEILPVLREAWARTEGIKAIMVGGLLLIYAAIVAATWVLGQVFGVEDETMIGSTVTQLVLMMIVYPFFAGVFMLGLRRSAGLPVRFEDQFSFYRELMPIVAVGALQSLVTFLGFMLLIVPGIYLTFALCLAVPLKAERNLPITDCLIMSARLVNRKFFEVTVLTLASVALAVLGIVSLIGWIWTMPWTLMILAIIYRQLAGFTPAAGTGAAGGPESGGDSGTVEF